MKLLDFDIVLASDLHEETRSSTEEWGSVVLGGDRIHVALASIVHEAVRNGFAAQSRREDRVELERGEQRLIFRSESSRLTIQILDPTFLPRARHDAAAVLIGDLRVDLSPASMT